MKKEIQLKLLKNEPKSYGGELLKTRKGRSHGRPLDTKNTMHLVLRSSKARGELSFWKKKNKNEIKRIISKFSRKHGVKILSMANVGNHLHFQIKLSNRYGYFAFIRAITAAIAMAVTGVNRWSSSGLAPWQRACAERLCSATDTSASLNAKGVGAGASTKMSSGFWDYRPFTRVVTGLRAFLNLRDYIRVNEFEGFGFKRTDAKFFLKWFDADGFG